TCSFFRLISMAADQNPNIDEELKRYAKQRRGQAGEPFELHPATRNLLQAEVARRLAKTPTGAPGFFGSLAALWPRFAVAGVVAGAILVCLVFWSDSDRERNAGVPYQVDQPAGKTSDGGNDSRNLFALDSQLTTAPTAPPPSPNAEDAQLTDEAAR